MKYLTSDGVEFHVLPHNARCQYVGTHPDNLDSCPISIRNFDDYGDICVPELCDYYDEVNPREVE